MKVAHAIAEFVDFAEFDYSSLQQNNYVLSYLLQPSVPFAFLVAYFVLSTPIAQIFGITPGGNAVEKRLSLVIIQVHSAVLGR